MEENGALPSQNQPPLPDSDPAAQDQSTKG
ncbi:hypothetical protein CP061683_0119A, partial [Chlamydia psittaci 06-1683]